MENTKKYRTYNFYLLNEIGNEPILRVHNVYIINQNERPGKLQLTFDSFESGLVLTGITPMLDCCYNTLEQTEIYTGNAFEVLDPEKALRL